ncbi:hypothetical protein PILCRDRAFT_810758 [Piloderma croceum F 1598]|uniref:Uncharacterized protein n=1 Tax=Piloderma croceum (strain F 1598) TaxID=765440 RepID=A0A0C3GIM7_PILCF|nr:hypothetical protein PILCRDRAFT_810758 [Piloderma croceum F 1598]
MDQINQVKAFSPSVLRIDDIESKRALWSLETMLAKFCNNLLYSPVSSTCGISAVWFMQS